jgi:hypothetical protein
VAACAYAPILLSPQFLTPQKRCAKLGLAPRGHRNVELVIAQAALAALPAPDGGITAIPLPDKHLARTIEHRKALNRAIETTEAADVHRTHGLTVV